MNKEFPLIKKIKKILIRTNRLNFIEDYLKRIVKEIAACFQVEHCSILLFTQSTLLKDLLVEIYECQDTTVLYPDDIASFPWLSQTYNKETIIHLPDLNSLEDTNPLKHRLLDFFCSPLRSGIIYPIYFNQTAVGSIILLYEYTIHLFTPYEIEILKQVSNYLTYALERFVENKLNETARKIIAHINDYYKLLNQDETQNKKPDIIAEVLLEVFDLRSVYMMKKNETRGGRWYRANIKENNKIESDTGIFIDSIFELMLEEAKKYCPGFIEVPIKNNGGIIGKLFVDYGKRENDQPFKEEIYRILLGTAHALAELMYY
jgi:hypothetical protein